MPFAQIQYRMLRNSPLGWYQRRRRFLCISITYTAIFLIIAGVFLGLYINERNSLEENNCASICGSVGTPYQCGNLQCCDQPDGIGSFYYNSYMYCLGDYIIIVYFFIMIFCFAYVAYEIFMIICIMCTSPIFYPGAEMMVQSPMMGMGYGGYGNNVVIT